MSSQAKALFNLKNSIEPDHIDSGMKQLLEGTLSV